MGETTRRAVLTGAAAISAAAVLTACGTSTDPGSGGDGGTTTGGDMGGTGGALAKKSDIPVGGGTIFDRQKVVVTQPTAGDFKAFSAICTHQGCTLSSVKGGTINCPCHGSKYSITDGSVKVAGPGNTPETQAPLAAKTVTVNGDEITVS
jgi:Rieske Fe-S protein